MHDVLSLLLLESTSPSLLLCIIGTAPVVQWSEFLAADPEVWVRVLTLAHFLRNSGFGTGTTQPLADN
jgi:hypothetical protein